MRVSPARPLRCLATVVLIGLSLGVASRSQAALIDFSNFDDFVAAATGAQQIVGFDEFLSGTAITNNISGITFAEASDVPLTALQAPAGDTLSPANFLGTSDSGSGQLTEFEEVIVTFDLPRSAVGLWVQYDPNLSVVTDILTLEDADTGAFAEVDDGDFVSLNSVNAFFIGLVDDTGTDSISEVSLFVNTLAGGGTEYTIDNLVTYQVAAVPEPTSLAFCGLMAGSAAWRRRRKRIAS